VNDVSEGVIQEATEHPTGGDAGFALTGGGGDLVEVCVLPLLAFGCRAVQVCMGQAQLCLLRAPPPDPQCDGERPPHAREAPLAPPTAAAVQFSSPVVLLCRQFLAILRATSRPVARRLYRSINCELCLLRELSDSRNGFRAGGRTLAVSFLRFEGVHDVHRGGGRLPGGRHGGDLGGLHEASMALHELRDSTPHRVSKRAERCRRRLRQPRGGASSAAQSTMSPLSLVLLISACATVLKVQAPFNMMPPATIHSIYVRDERCGQPKRR
jgi:hypothetical protein